MKTIFKTALVACIALTTMLVGCSKEEGVNTETGAKTISIKISRGDVTKAPDVQVNDGSEVALNDASIYFTQGTVVVARYDIDVDGEPTETDENPDTGDISLEQLEGQINGNVDGYTFTNLPSTVNNVYFVGNSPIGFNIADINELTATDAIELASQTNITNAALYGATNGLGTGTVVDGTTTYAVEILVKPVVARLEIGNIAANWTTAPYVSTITAFDLLGIYIDNHYTEMGIDGSLAEDAELIGAPVIEDGLTEDEITALNAAHYVAANYVDMSDESFVKLNGGFKGFPGYIASDEEHAVWAYNFLAAKNAPAPRIVIKVENVVITNALGEADEDAYAGVKYLTVGSIKDLETKEIITAIEAGKIYRISNLSFAQGHLTANPNIGQIDIEVEVEIMNWDVVDVEHIFE